MLKLTSLFNAVTVDDAGNAQRSGGWSESVYGDGIIDSLAFNTKWAALLNARAALLPENTTIIGERVQTVDPLGPARTYENIYPGTNATQNDLPQVALEYQLRSATGFNRRPMILRGTPDIRIVRGEYSGIGAYNAALSAFFSQLVGNWLMRCIDRTQPKIRVVLWNQGAEHICTTETPHGLAPNDVVLQYSGLDSAFKKRSGKYRVSTVSDATHFTVFNFPGALSLAGGKMRKEVIQFLPMTINNQEIVTPLAVVRKVGRPFHLFRGRRSTRR